MTGVRVHSCATVPTMEVASMRGLIRMITFKCEEIYSVEVLDKESIEQHRYEQLTEILRAPSWYIFLAR